MEESKFEVLDEDNLKYLNGFSAWLIGMAHQNPRLTKCADEVLRFARAERRKSDTFNHLASQTGP